MSSAIRKIGNSAGVILPRPVMESLGAKLGDQIEFVAENGRIFLSPVTSDPRAGWAEAAKAIAAEGLTEEEREWMDAPLTDDEDWVW